MQGRTLQHIPKSKSQREDSARYLDRANLVEGDSVSRCFADDQGDAVGTARKDVETRTQESQDESMLATVAHSEALFLNDTRARKIWLQKIVRAF